MRGRVAQTLAAPFPFVSPLHSADKTRHVLYRCADRDCGRLDPGLDAGFFSLLQRSHRRRQEGALARLAAHGLGWNRLAPCHCRRLRLWSVSVSPWPSAGKGFGCKILYHDVKPIPALADPLGAEYVSFDDLLARSDFLSVHCPALPETNKIFNATNFAKMKKGIVFVNPARGAVVDQKALYDALKSGQVAFAGLDVTDPEPLPPNDPLLSLKNCLVVPHVGSASIATRVAMGMLAADNIMIGLGLKQGKGTLRHAQQAVKERLLQVLCKMAG